MALAKKCDRCKKLYEYYPVGNEETVNSIRKCKILMNGSIMYKDDVIDLCPECKKEFDKFMMEGSFRNDS